MENNKKKLYNELFFSGLEKEEFQEILPALRDQNYETWRMVASVLFPVFLGLFILSFFNRIFMPSRWLYFISALLHLAIVIYFIGFKGANRKAANILSFVGALSMYVFGIVLSTFNSPNEVAVTFFVLQLAVPLVTMSQPIASDLFIVLGTAAFCICAFAAKPAALAEEDSYNAVIFMLVTIIANHHIQKTNATSKNLQLVLNREAEEAIAHANMDELTGVRSRHAYTIAKEAMNNDISFHLAGNFAVGIFDINGLKDCNDRLGHTAGDRLIKDVAELLNSTFKYSQIFRVGGDEFIVFFRGYDYVNRKELMQKVYDISAENILTDGPSVAGGLGELEEEDRSVQEAINRADEMMYRQKEQIKRMKTAE